MNRRSFFYKLAIAPVLAVIGVSETKASAESLGLELLYESNAGPVWRAWTAKEATTAIRSGYVLHGKGRDKIGYCMPQHYYILVHPPDEWPSKEFISKYGRKWADRGLK